MWFYNKYGDIQCPASLHNHNFKDSIPHPSPSWGGLNRIIDPFHVVLPKTIPSGQNGAPKTSCNRAVAEFKWIATSEFAGIWKPHDTFFKSKGCTVNNWKVRVQEDKRNLEHYTSCTIFSFSDGVIDPEPPTTTTTSPPPTENCFREDTVFYGNTSFILASVSAEACRQSCLGFGEFDCVSWSFSGKYCVHSMDVKGEEALPGFVSGFRDSVSCAYSPKSDDSNFAGHQVKQLVQEAAVLLSADAYSSWGRRGITFFALIFV
jgi:hypothetical protein